MTNGHLQLTRRALMAAAALLLFLFAGKVQATNQIDQFLMLRRKFAKANGAWAKSGGSVSLMQDTM